MEALSFTWANGQPALRGCHLELPHPGLWMLVGSNGSGKSTLLRLIVGLLPPCGGLIDMPGKAALVFQNPDHQLLMPSCGSDLQLSLPEGLSPQERQARADVLLAQVGLAALAARAADTLEVILEDDKRARERATKLIEARA